MIFKKIENINYYRQKFGRMPNLIMPKTFNEKILLKILFDRNPKLTLFTDKFLVRDFVKSRLGGDEHLTKLYAVVDNPMEISKLNLPNKFVMKPNHASGKTKIVYNLKSLEHGELEKLATTWLQQNYYDVYNEWAYKNIKPRIIFEELLEFRGQIPDDWKFFCFNGEPRFIQIDRDRFIKHERNIYDLNLSLLPVRINWENFQEKVNKPQNFDKMVEITKKLSTGTDFIRVDLYNINGRIIFGELTNYPEAGLGKFEPSSWDIKFGNYWKR
jgi:hypothetical protein